MCRRHVFSRKREGGTAREAWGVPSVQSASAAPQTVEPFTAAQVSKCQPVLASFLFPFKRIRLKKQKSEASVLSMVRILKFRAKCVYTIKSAFCYSFKRRPLAFWRSISLMTSAIYAAASTGGMPNRLILDTTV